jgi:hypothetical protein
VGRVWAAATARWRKGREARPWLVVIDAKGGFDSRDTAHKAREVLRDLGAQKIGIWPDEVALNPWALPSDRLAEVLCGLVPTAAEGPAAYYADVLVSVVGLAVNAPPGPPADSADFLARLDAGWLARAYAGDPEHAGEVSAAREHVGDVRLRFRTLFTRLGPGFDGDAAVTGFDALYCIVEGTASVAVGEAQARALTELVAEAASSWTGKERRAGLLVLNEFSAVAGRVPVHELTERCRSLGLAVQVAAQSWESLAPEDSQRSRLAATAAGGVLVMRCPDPEALCRLAGTQAVIETGRKIVGPGQYGEEGTGRLQRAWVTDPDRVRSFRAGQAAWICGNACTYVRVAPYRRSPLPLPAAPELAPGLLPGGQGEEEEGGKAASPAGPPVPLPGGEAR